MVRWIKIASGPLLALLLYEFTELDPENHKVTSMAGIALWMAVWWMTEAVPLAVTAVLPLVLFPIFGITSTKSIAPSYMDHIIFLFIGGFLLSFAMEKWNLHRRIAVNIILLVGVEFERILMGFMLSAYILSMWISNIATTVMLVPTALAILGRLAEMTPVALRSKIAIPILLGVAYAASIGGTASLIGTAPNLIFLNNYNRYFPDLPNITFSQWFSFGFPTSLVLLLICYWFLKRMYLRELKVVRPGIEIFREEKQQIGKMSYEEMAVAVVFTLTAILWFTRTDLELGAFVLPGWGRLWSLNAYISDGTIAIFMSILLFLIPAKNAPGTLMDWKTAEKLPFNIILLFGGGFALAKGFNISGLSLWLGDQLVSIRGVPVVVMILVICVGMTFITELTSNTATSQLLLPILATAAIALKVNPVLLMVPATFSASFAFMLPVATPPNTVVFGTNKIPIREMNRVGFRMNLVGVVIITISILTLGKLVF